MHPLHMCSLHVGQGGRRCRGTNSYQFVWVVPKRGGGWLLKVALADVPSAVPFERARLPGTDSSSNPLCQSPCQSRGMGLAS